MSAIEEIEKLKKLLDEGTLSKEQYDLLLNDIIGKNKKPSKEEQLLADGAITKEQFNILTKQSTSSSPPPSTNTEKKSSDQANLQDDEYTLIGKTKWVNKCLRITNYNNGKSIPVITNLSELEHSTNNEIGGYFSIDFPFGDYELYHYGKDGFLYNFTDILEIIPSGYRIPNSEEWAELFLALGMTKSQEGYSDLDWKEFVSKDGVRDGLFFGEQGFVRVDETGGGLFRQTKKTINFYNDGVAYAMLFPMNAIVDGEEEEGHIVLSIIITDEGETIIESNPQAVYLKLVIDE